jgi:hypothetical protein
MLLSMSPWRPCSCAALVIALAYPCFGAKKRDWQPGKVLDADVYEYQTQSGSHTGGRVDGKGNVGLDTTNSTETVKQTRYVIIGGSYRYVVEETNASSDWGPDHALITRRLRRRCHLIVGDSIQFAEDRTTLRLIDADGRECKLEVLRQERISSPAK